MPEQTFSELPDLSSTYPLSPASIQQYQWDGHVLLRDVASSAEIATYHTVIKDAALRYNTEKRALQERDTYGKAFLQIMNLWAKEGLSRTFCYLR